MILRSRRARALSAAAALALLLAACGDDDDEDTAAATTEAPAAEAEEPDETTTSAPDEEPAAGGLTIEVTSSDLGDILTIGGRTLYMFTPDEGGEPTCYDECAARWPALMADGEVTGDGIDSSLLGTVARTDGGEQVTANGWPLYFFAADAAPGDTAGQGVGDVWWVLGADGEPIMT